MLSNAFVSLVNDLISITGYGSVYDGEYGRILGSSSASCLYAQTQCTAVSFANTTENKNSKGVKDCCIILLPCNCLISLR